MHSEELDYYVNIEKLVVLMRQNVKKLCEAQRAANKNSD